METVNHLHFVKINLLDVHVLITKELLYLNGNFEEILGWNKLINIGG